MKRSVPVVWIGQHGLELIRMPQQQVPQIHDGASGGLSAPPDDKRDVRSDLFGGQIVAVDFGLAEFGDDVFASGITRFIVEKGGRFAPFFNDASDIIFQMLARFEALLVGR